MSRISIFAGRRRVVSEPANIPHAIMERSASSSAPYAIDAAVFLFLLGALFFYPWHYDEGWTDLTIVNARTTGVYSYVVDNGDVSLTFIKPWYALLNLFCFPSLGPGHVFLMRLPGLALSMIGWTALRAALRRLALDSLQARVMAGFIWAVVAAEFFVNLRPEAAYVPALAIALLLSLEWIHAARLSVFLAGLGLIALTVGTHPCGLLVPLVLAAALPFGRPNFSWKDGCWIATAVVATVGASAAMILWDQSPAAFLRNLAAATDATHSLSWRDEWHRYFEFFDRFRPLGMCYMSGFLGAPLLLCSERIAWRARTALLIQVLVVGAFLLFYPAKWHYYLSAYAPWLSIVWARLGETLTMLGRRFPPLPGALALVIAFDLVMIAYHRYAPGFDPNEASLLRSSVLEPVFGLAHTEQEKRIDSIPELVKDHRVLAELYMFPIVNLLSLNKASFDDAAPPDFLIEAQSGFVPLASARGEFSTVVDPPQWPTTRWITVLQFRFEGNLVAVARPAP